MLTPRANVFSDYATLHHIAGQRIITSDDEYASPAQRLQRQCAFNKELKVTTTALMELARC
ncbi:MAG: hypothetical protein R3183_11415 [Oleiphilaceae bacterium]|nr:hypothetical protein [Oleiphilaceae bacterium]